MTQGTGYDIHFSTYCAEDHAMRHLSPTRHTISFETRLLRARLKTLRRASAVERTIRSIVVRCRKIRKRVRF